MSCSGGGEITCDLLTNSCVQQQDCEQHDQCMAPGMPICDGDMCRGCESPAECMERDPNLTECTAEGECREPEPNMCERSVDCPTNQPMCNGTECVACTPDEAGDAVCDERASENGNEEGRVCTGAGTCGECRNDAHCTAVDRPICDTDAGTCRACQANSECDSNVCDKLSGQCAAVADVIYVDDASGNDDNACDRAAPCKTISNALDLVEPDTHRYIRIEEGVYAQVLSISDKNVTLVSDGATIQPAPGQTNTPVLRVTSGAVAALQEIVITGATNGTNADGIECQSNSEVSLISTTVTSNAYLGIDALQCSLTVARSTISRNLGGGLSVRDTDFSVTNSLIVDNGDVASTAFGGAKIDNTAGISRQIFSFNTIARNKAQDLGDASGVRCSTTGTAMTASNNIVYEGFGDAAPVDGNCLWTYSNIEGGFTGTGNIDEDPMFVDSASGDFHLQPGSPCEDAADLAASITVDFDGDSRPQGGAADMGADEIVPAQ